jgi:peptidoglycan/LPS O-acetylase OafA/YrhL
MPKKATLRSTQLDGLRAFAMAGVFLDHFAWKQMKEWDVVGWMGLEVFLAMSGFLTTMILLKDHAAAEAAGRSRWAVLGQFYIRRALRIFPVYYLALGVALAANFPHAREAFGWLATYTANLYVIAAGGLESLGYLSHLWSMSVQEQFYIAWALLMVLVPRRWLTWVACGMVLTGPLYRFVGIQVGLSDTAVYFFTPSCVDALGLGVLLCLAYTTPALRPRLGPGLAALAGLGAVVAWVATAVDDTRPTFTVVAFTPAIGLVACWLIYGAMEGFKGPVGWVLGWRPVAYVGRISYGLFVYQFLARPLVTPLVERFGLGIWPGGMRAFFLYSVVTIAIASLSWHLLEKPIHGYAQRFRAA